MIRFYYSMTWREFNPELEDCDAYVSWLESSEPDLCVCEAVCSVHDERAVCVVSADRVRVLAGRRGVEAGLMKDLACGTRHTASFFE